MCGCHLKKSSSCSCWLYGSSLELFHCIGHKGFKFVYICIQ
ncbi:hypothetical protein AHF37_10489 [Paragonimus kellicotti]|nr:hypothetical protein AHF37_10489 [Paragonimus kellicotti]